MTNLFYTLFAISISLLLGKLANYLLAGLPASLYGMIFYAVFLQLNWLSADRVAVTNQWLIRHMGVCFVPAAIGIINHFQLLQQHGLALVGIIFSTTFILITFIGLLSERFLIKSVTETSDMRADND
ncbi:CidA/LrgA family protein [Colwellia echini]|uniref:CidA/LrgA family protein n=1 Tax=Colwellia echini TaxID=1982103 RepID=A0ABY3MVM3_9GAMM|nr:CidA/LrgA family protein [Colwellia echini]TYK65186.1 CidA/LrgA family protein [Colwellia echini]